MGSMGEDEKMELLEEADEVDINELQQASEDAPVVRLVNMILNEAIKRKASDIHLEPYEKVFRVRLRVDGVLNDFMKPPMKMKNAIISRVKIMAKLDIAERRLPQDGRIKMKLGGTRRWISEFPFCPLCSEKRWSCACSTNQTFSST